MKTALELVQIAIAAPVPEDLASKMYWHGTATTENAAKIWTSGLIPQQVDKPQRWMAPVPGRVYITEQLSYALIYAYGASMIGMEPHQQLIDHYGRYGYVFQIEGSALIDVLPDEDGIGRLATDALNGKGDSKLYWLGDLVKIRFSSKTLFDLKFGSIGVQARVGKRILKMIDDQQAISLIRAGAHISHGGNLQISKCWRLDRTKVDQLAKDGSNFFENAVQVKTAADII